MAAILPATTKRTNKSRFCRAQAFTRNDNAAYRLIASWFHVEKQEKEKKMRVIPKSAVFFSLRGRQVVEFIVLAEALDWDC